MQTTSAPKDVNPNNVVLKCSYIDHTANAISITGVTTNSIKVDASGLVTADCSSSHLTSFVLTTICLELAGSSCVNVCPDTYKVNTA